MTESMPAGLRITMGRLAVLALALFASCALVRENAIDNGETDDPGKVVEGAEHENGEKKLRSIEKQTKVHRLRSTRRSRFDAFVYLNRIPEQPAEGETSRGFAGRVHGRLANQEGRVLLKLPSGMDRRAYLGFKAFLGSEGNDAVTGCVSCHPPASFSDSRSHILSAAGAPKVTASLRNLKKPRVDLDTAIRAKIDASRLKRSGNANEIDDAYEAMGVTRADVPNLIAFLHSLVDVSDSEFREIIINARVLDTSEELDSIPPLRPGDSKE